MWMRIRFKVNLEDPRPIKFPPPGPYWITGRVGFDTNIHTLVGHFREMSQVKEFWPEAYDLEGPVEVKITFSDRFPKPDWWTEDV